MIVEDGTIVANADSYLTIADFKAYWRSRNVVVTQDDPCIESALVIATQYMDINNCWKGAIANAAQSLGFPRFGIIDREGRIIASTDIPNQLKNALAEYAHRQLSETISPDSGLDGDVVYQRDKVDILESETHYEEGTASSFKSFPMADNWLKGLTSGGLAGNFGQVSRCL